MTPVANTVLDREIQSDIIPQIVLVSDNALQFTRLSNIPDKNNFDGNNRLK